MKTLKFNLLALIGGVLILVGYFYPYMHYYSDFLLTDIVERASAISRSEDRVLLLTIGFPIVGVLLVFFRSLTKKIKPYFL